MPEATKEVFEELPNVRWKPSVRFRDDTGVYVDRRVHLWVPADFTGFPGCDDRFWYEEKPTPTLEAPGYHGRDVIFAQRDTAIFRGQRVDYHPELRPRFIFHDVADDNSDFRA